MRKKINARAGQHERLPRLGLNTSWDECKGRFRWRFERLHSTGKALGDLGFYGIERSWNLNSRDIRAEERF